MSLLNGGLPNMPADMPIGDFMAELIDGITGDEWRQIRTFVHAGFRPAFRATELLCVVGEFRAQAGELPVGHPLRAVPDA